MQITFRPSENISSQLQEHSDGSIVIPVGVKRMTIDELQRELESTTKENIELNWKNERLREENDVLRRENARLREELKRVQKELEEGRSKPRRQVAPFSRGEPKANPKRPGRGKGHKGAKEDRQSGGGAIAKKLSVV